MTRATLFTIVALAAAAAPARAQSVRMVGTTSVRYIELRPLLRDSIASEDAVGSGLLRQLPDGRIVRCITGEAFCRDTQPGARVSTVPVSNDLELSAWGLGRGVRLFAHLRARAAWGGSPELWPRGDEGLELVGAYAELERASYRVRAGRQWKVSGLGFYNFDGVALTVRPASSASVELYGGRSLMRGLNETRASGALAAADPMTPSDAGVLLGVQARYRPSTRAAVGATYQTDFRANGTGIYSELIAVDGVMRVGGGSVESSIEADVSTRSLNEARVRLRAPPLRGTAAHAELRRYRPYFELWTIWGAFSPVGFTEAQTGVTWSDARGTLLLRGEAMYRAYDDADEDAAREPMRSRGFSVGGSASWEPADAWRLDAAYRVETGVGAARRDGHVGVLRELGESSTLRVQALAFQRLYEFRLTEGTVLGLGAEASLRLSPRAQLFASATGYRHVGAEAVPGIDWNQRRASLRLQWAVGAEPVMRGGIQ